MYMKIPNSFLTDLTFSEFAVAVKLYSLVNSHTKVNGKGFEVCIKQSTLSKHSGLSESTVKRVLRALKIKGIVIGKYRQKGTGGFLGAYHYTLKPFSFLSDYFIMPNRVFVHRLSPKLLFVYSLCHKLKRNGSMDFFHSYNDMAKMLGMKRSEVIWCINELIRRKLVHRQRKRTKSGDYTDNTYIIARYEKG
jgi:predicted transcriptional regulator